MDHDGDHDLVAVDELFGNIAKYAYPSSDGDVAIRVQINRKKPEITITFIDSGEPFDPLEAEDPDTTLPASQRKIGGLGIYMVKQSMDEVGYAYQDGKNILTIRKTIEP